MAGFFDYLHDTLLPKTRLDLLYDNLHEKEKVLDLVLFEIKKTDNNVDLTGFKPSHFTPFTDENIKKIISENIQAAIEEKLKSLNDANLSDSLRKKEYIFWLSTLQNKLIEDVTRRKAQIKLHKANRRWYDITQWSTNEKKGRLWYALVYALLCGISIFASIQPIGLPAQVLVGMICAIITFGVNWSAFWDNIARRLDEGTRDHLKGIYSPLYKIFCWSFVGVTSLLTTGYALSTVRGTLSMGGMSYWAFFPILVALTSTVVALQGLMTQEPRLWFKSFEKYGFIESVERTGLRLWHGLTTPEDGDKPTAELSSKNTNVFMACMRVALFLTFTGIMTFAAYTLAPFAATATLELVLQFLGKSSGQHLLHSGAAAIISNIFVPVLSGIFIIGSACYNATTAGKLSVLATALIGKSARIMAEPFEHPLIKKYPERLFVLTVIPVLPVLAVGNLIVTALTSLVEKEIECWREAKTYARKQCILKGADFDYISVHFISRLLFNHMPVWGTVNAVNNASLTIYKKLEAKGVDFLDLNPKETLNFSLAAGSGFSRSYGFFWVTKGRRDEAMAQEESSIELNEDILAVKKCSESRYWSRPEDMKSFDSTAKNSSKKTYGDFFA